MPLLPMRRCCMLLSSVVDSMPPVWTAPAGKGMCDFVIPFWYESPRHPCLDPVLRRRPLPEFPPGGGAVAHDPAAIVARHQGAGRQAGRAPVRARHAGRGLDAGGTHPAAAGAAHPRFARDGAAIAAARQRTRAPAPGLDEFRGGRPVPSAAGGTGGATGQCPPGIDGGPVAAPGRGRAQGPARCGPACAAQRHVRAGRAAAGAPAHDAGPARRPPAGEEAQAQPV